MASVQPITMLPIGHVKSDFSTFAAVDEMRPHTSRLIIRPELVAGLEGLEAGRRIVVLFAFHQAEGYLIRRHPRDNPDNPIRGVFALRSQYRPNPIGATVAQIVSIVDNVLEVTGLDALDGSPLLDIKPYVQDFDDCAECDPEPPKTGVPG